jgi:endonuclease G
MHLLGGYFMHGYNPAFLGADLEIPLPRFRASLVEEVLSKPELREGTYADYIYYTVAMHRDFRTPLFAALNIDRSKSRTTTRTSRWNIDSRVGPEHQLNNDYYRRNDWDRGHLAMRYATAWGDTGRQAQKAADETFYYTNSTLQHANFNQDEWLALEKWVMSFPAARREKICEFSGPIFGDYMRTIRPTARPVAFVPTAFYKVLAFLNTDDQLEVRAFIIFQDEAALSDKQGKKTFNNQIYQVAVADVEALTGLEFPDELAAVNPIWFKESESALAVKNVDRFPERRDVNGAEDIVFREQDPRPYTYKDEEIPIFIAGALVDPAGPEREGEWVSLLNLSGETISIEGWTLLDKNRRTLSLTGEIGPGEARRIQPLSPIRLANKPDDDQPGLIILNNADGDQVDRVSYRRRDLPGEGKPVIFAYTYTDEP